MNFLSKYLYSNTMLFLTVFCFFSTDTSFAQSKLKNMPGYERYKEVSSKIRDIMPGMRISGFTWAEDGKSFTYEQKDTIYTYDIRKKRIVNAVKKTPRPKAQPRKVQKTRSIGDIQARMARMNLIRQKTFAISPNKKLKAFTKDRNMYLSNADGSDVIAITTDANTDNKLKYGAATWVYGEELRQGTAMWWSPDNKKIAFYRFDETDAVNYYLIYDQTKIQDTVYSEPYTKVGAKNFPVDLLVYDLETQEIITLDTRDGLPFNDGALGTYLYGIEWSPDGSELLFHSTNRKQDIMEYKAADPNTGKTRVIVREEWPASFTENSPKMYKLKDKKHFIWTSERTGFKNYYLYRYDGTLVNTITRHDFEVFRILKIDEEKGWVYYMARSGDNHMKLQLHRVRLDGTGDIRLTDPAYDHTIILSPRQKYFIDIAQTHNIPPFVNLLNAKGKVVAEITKADIRPLEELGYTPAEVFTFTSADGETELHGMIHFPSNFDPSKKYPVLLDNYGGPATNAFKENFAYPSWFTEFGFLIVNIDGRNVKGRGKRLLDKLYGNLCIVEIDDFAAGIKSLYNRPYVDKDRVGAFGGSYGGTTAAASLLRYPDVYHAAVANSPVTDWRNYDNIYTERYMNLLENNLEGYEAASLMNYAKDLKGDFMIFYGTVDNNVHPSNSLQLIKALQDARKSFEVQVGPDQGHTGVDMQRMMEFFIQHLILEK